MKIKNKLTLLLCFIGCMIIMTGCSIGGSSKNKVAFIPPLENNGAFWDDINANLKEQVEAKGFDYELNAPKEWGSQFQVKIIENLIKNGTNVIVLAPIGKDELFPVIKKANKAGVEIILIDNNIDRDFLDSYGAHVTTFVGIDNYKCGKDVADNLCTKLTSGDQVAVFSGGADSTNSEQRTNGFMDEAQSKGMKIVSRTAVDWSADDAYAKAKFVFKAYPDIKGVFSVNSSINSGVCKAAKECGVTMISAAFDTDDEILNSIKEGSVSCTMDQNSQEMAKNLANVIEKMNKHEKIANFVESEGKLITQ